MIHSTAANTFSVASSGPENFSVGNERGWGADSAKWRCLVHTSQELTLLTSPGTVSKSIETPLSKQFGFIRTSKVTLNYSYQFMD